LETWAGGEKEWSWACEKRKEGEKRIGPAGGWAAGWKEREGEREERVGGFYFFQTFSNSFFKLLKLIFFSSNFKFKLFLTFQTFKTF
jgi:hypothetical protein